MVVDYVIPSLARPAFDAVDNVLFSGRKMPVGVGIDWDSVVYVSNWKLSVFDLSALNFHCSAL